jgi:hypothetical protein
MDGFIQIGNSLINGARLLAVQHKPEETSGVLYSPEHYLAVFDTRQEIRLSVEDGQRLVDYSSRHLRTSPLEGNMPTTSDLAT